MAMLELNDVIVSSHYELHGQGSMSVYLNSGVILPVRCPPVNDNWAKETQTICGSVLGNEHHQYQMQSLQLQRGSDGVYVLVNGVLQDSHFATIKAFNIGDGEVDYMLSLSEHKGLLPFEFIAIILFLVVAMFGMKVLLEYFLISEP